MQKILNPRVDPIFKILFTQNTKESKNALQCFVSACIGKSISDIELQPNELTSPQDDFMQSRFDLTCTIDGVEHANIELQGQNLYNNFDDRSEYYVAHLLDHYIVKGSNKYWDNVPTVYQINILNFIYDKSCSNGFSHFSMRRKDGSPLLSQKLNIFYMELPKYKNDNDIIENIANLTTVEKWSKFFMYADDISKQEYIKALCNTEEGIMDAKVTLGTISQDEINWKKQTDYFMLSTDHNTMIHSAEKRGIAEGIRLSAANMKKDGLPIDKIMQYTGLSEDEVNAL